MQDILHNQIHENFKNFIDVSINIIVNHLNRNNFDHNQGCIDRLFWAWKFTDYSDATLQRCLYPLAWYCFLEGSEDQELKKKALIPLIKTGLTFCSQIQHADGSFDQAYPNEHSYGATAFLLNSLFKTYALIKNTCDIYEIKIFETFLRKAADYLCDAKEEHGFIANHLAGASLSLFIAGDFFQEERYKKKAEHLVQKILNSQSHEGWYLEYNGADPGYQTLCLHYLTQISYLHHNLALENSIHRSIEFLSHFVHPDGTFGGKYGSRRTSLFYPSGFFLMQEKNKMARKLYLQFMHYSFSDFPKKFSSLPCDLGNLAPLLESLLICYFPPSVTDHVNGEVLPLLPFEREDYCKCYIDAGYIVKSTKIYFSIVGISNGGIVKIYNKFKKSLIWEEDGYVGELSTNILITNQEVNIKPPYNFQNNELEFECDFFFLNRLKPNTFYLILVRLMSLTFFHFKIFREIFKKLLIKNLIIQKKFKGLRLKRKICFDSNRIIITDEILLANKVNMKSLGKTYNFCSIHMASSGYFDGWFNPTFKKQINLEELKKSNKYSLTEIIHIA